MRKDMLFAVAAFGGVMTLCSCAKEVFNEQVAEPNSRLTVMTRAGEDDAVVKFPVGVYVFDAEAACVKSQTLADAEASLSISLPAGTYDVLAVGGMDAERYALPSTVKKDSPVALLSGKVHDDLMTGKSTVTLVADGENTLTLGLERRVMMIESVKISNVPAEVQTVSISIEPLYETLLLDGSYQGENGSCTIALEKQDDGTTWSSRENDFNYQLPSVGKPTIAVNIDNTTYSYNCERELEANYKFAIEGAYVSNNGSTEVTLSGTITGATWAGKETIRFTFNEEGSQTVKDEEDNKEPEKPANVPEVGTLYEGHYVIAVNGNEVTVLSSKDKSGIVSSNDSDQSTLRTAIDIALSNWADTYSTEWRLMNYDEALYFRNNSKKISSVSGAAVATNTGYFFEHNDIIYHLIPDSQVSLTQNIGGRSSTYLRPVTTITFQ